MRFKIDLKEKPHYLDEYLKLHEKFQVPLHSSTPEQIRIPETAAASTKERKEGFSPSASLVTLKTRCCTFSPPDSDEINSNEGVFVINSLLQVSKITDLRKSVKWIPSHFGRVKSGNLP